MSSIFTEDITPIYNEDILNEYDTVLRRKKFNFSEEFINETLDTIKEKGIHTDRINSGDVLPDPKDLVFYEVALSVDDSFLVTGNLKHFPKKPFIVSPAEMLEIIDALVLGNKNILSEAGARYGK